MKMKYVLWAALAVFLAGSGYTLATYRTARSSTVQALPAVPPGNKIPPRQFLDDYREFVALRDQIREVTKNDHIQEMTDRLNSMVSRLQGQIPPGYSWDEQSESFKPQLPPAAPPAPTPEPSAKK